MDPTFIEFAKEYGIAAALAAAVIIAQLRVIVVLFKKYEASQAELIKMGASAFTKMSESTMATQANTAAVETLREMLRDFTAKSRGR